MGLVATNTSGSEKSSFYPAAAPLNIYLFCSGLMLWQFYAFEFRSIGTVRDQQHVCVIKRRASLCARPQPHLATAAARPQTCSRCGGASSDELQVRATVSSYQPWCNSSASRWSGLPEQAIKGLFSSHITAICVANGAALAHVAAHI